MKMLQFLVESVKQSLGDDSVSKQAVYEELEALLDRSIKVDAYKVTQNFRVKDLSKIDYAKLRQEFEQKQKRSIIQQLAKAMKETTEQMIGINPKRKGLMEKLEKIMESYNKGSKEIEQIFEELVKLSQEINEEEQRAVKQEMTEEQLAVFDLLYKEELSEDDKKAIKTIAKELLDIVKSIITSSVKRREKEQTQAELKVTITNYLYDHLPITYDEQLLEHKTQELYLYLYEHMRV
jgi:type I restriction enzyme R subunit